MRHTVQAVILNDEGEVLAVSRKDDHTDFGLVGGKVDPEDYDFNAGLFNSAMEVAMIRECREETGIDVRMGSAEVIFAMHKDGHMGTTYLIRDWSGEINYDEPHVVKWTPFQTVLDGKFGWWNKMVSISLDSMGVEYLKQPKPDGQYYFEINKDYKGRAEVNINPKSYWEREECLTDHYTDGERDEIFTMMKNAGFSGDELCEALFQLIDKNGNRIVEKSAAKKLMLKAGFLKDEDFSKFILR